MLRWRWIAPGKENQGKEGGLESHGKNHMEMNAQRSPWLPFLRVRQAPCGHASTPQALLMSCFANQGVEEEEEEESSC